MEKMDQWEPSRQKKVNPKYVIEGKSSEKILLDSIGWNKFIHRSPDIHSSLKGLGTFYGTPRKK